MMEEKQFASRQDYINHQKNLIRTKNAIKDKLAFAIDGIQNSVTNSGVFDKNNREIRLGDTIMWKDFNGIPKDGKEFPTEEEFQLIHREVVFKNGAFGVCIAQNELEPLCNWIDEHGQLFSHTFYGYTDESKNMQVKCDFQILDDPQ